MVNLVATGRFGKFGSDGALVWRDVGDVGATLGDTEILPFVEGEEVEKGERRPGPLFFWTNHGGTTAARDALTGMASSSTLGKGLVGRATGPLLLLAAATGVAALVGSIAAEEGRRGRGKVMDTTHRLRRGGREGNILTIARGLGSDEEAADRLEELRRTGLQLMDEIGSGRGRRRLLKALLVEMPSPPSSTPSSPSFPSASPPGRTINKGERIELCLRDGASGDLLSYDHLLVVFLHELAHVAAEGVGHGREFDTLLSALRRAAHEMGILDSSNLQPSEYCGFWVRA